MRLAAVRIPAVLASLTASLTAGWIPKSSAVTIRNFPVLTTGHRQAAATVPLPGVARTPSAGTPHNTSRIRFAMDTARASSLLMPSAWPNSTKPASCTPSPAGTMNATCRIACVMLSNITAARTSTGWPKSRNANHTSNEAERNARSCSIPAKASALPRERQARSSRSSAAAPPESAVSPTMGRRKDFEAPEYGAIAQQQSGHHRDRQTQQQRNQHVPVSLCGSPEIAQQEQPRSREHIQGHHGQQHFGSYSRRRRRRRYAAPPGEADSGKPSADTRYRQKAVDPFAHRRYPEQVAEPGAALRIVGTEEDTPTDGVEKEVQQPIRRQPQQIPTGGADRAPHGSEVRPNDENRQQRQAQQPAHIGCEL